MSDSLEKRLTYLSRQDLQYVRKVFHILAGILGIIVYDFLGLNRLGVLFVLSLFLIFSLTFDFIRIYNRQVELRLFKIFRLLLRQEEQKSLNSASKGFLAFFVVIALFPWDVGRLALLYFSFADPMGGIIGARYGKLKINRHASLVGSLAVFFTAFLCTVLASVLGFLDASFSPFNLVAFSVLCGLSVAIAEGAIYQWDDNLTVPLFSAPVAWLLLKVFSF